MIAALLLTRFMQSLLFDVHHLDPLTFAVIAVFLAAVACWLVTCRQCAPRASIPSSRCGLNKLRTFATTIRPLT